MLKKFKTHPLGLKIIILISSLMTMAWFTILMVAINKITTSKQMTIYAMLFIVFMASLYSYATYGLICLKNSARVITLVMSTLMVCGALAKLVKFYINYANSGIFFAYPLLTAIAKLIVFTYPLIYLNKSQHRALFEV